MSQTGSATSTWRCSSYFLTADGKARPLVAIDYLGAGIGDTVLVSTSPGLADRVFPGQQLPADALIIGLIDPAS